MEIPANWTFETSDVATGFDSHVREQLPWYDLATAAITAAETYEYEPFDLGISFLTLMFVEPSKRRDFVIDLLEKCRPGGAIVIFDKLESAHGYLGTIMSRLTLAGKYEAGVDAREIIEKELSLAGVQRPITLEQLPGAPYQWFRFGDFAGYILEKPI